MVERLSAADVAFLHLEGRTYAAACRWPGRLRPARRRLRLRPPGAAARGADLARAALPAEGAAVPGHLANPIWVDDPAFDITYHVRRSALPRPGSDAQLLEFCSRIQSRLLDRSRPLWEMYLVEGLAGGRVAIVTKTHQAMVDGRARSTCSRSCWTPPPSRAVPCRPCGCHSRSRARWRCCATPASR